MKREKISLVSVMSLRGPLLDNALCKQCFTAGLVLMCRPTFNKAEHLIPGLRASAYRVTCGDLAELKSAIFAPEMFPAQRWKAVEPLPSPCPSLDAFI